MSKMPKPNAPAKATNTHGHTLANIAFASIASGPDAADVVDPELCPNIIELLRPSPFPAPSPNLAVVLRSFAAMRSRLASKTSAHAASSPTVHASPPRSARQSTRTSEPDGGVIDPAMPSAIADVATTRKETAQHASRR